MPTNQQTTDTQSEPLRRFYPPEGMRTQPQQKRDDAAYLAHRHPILLQRLYQTTDSFLDRYPPDSFLYDAYPDYQSLRLMRDRILRENQALTEQFLQSGCPLTWLNLLTDTVISDLLCRKRCIYRKPSGEASTTSVTSAARS